MHQHDDLAERIQALEDERGCVRAIYGFAHGLDNKERDVFLNVWADEAVFEVRDRDDAVTARTEGRAGFEKMIDGVPGPPKKFVKRLPTAPIVNVTGDDAHAETYFTRFDELGANSPYIYAYGRYFDHLIRCPDGQWRIKHRLARVDAEVKL